MEKQAEIKVGTVIDSADGGSAYLCSVCQDALLVGQVQRQRQLLLHGACDCEINQALATVLEEERDLLHTIMEHTHAQIAYLDPEFNILRANAVFAQSVGYSASTLLGRSYFDLFSDEDEAIFRRVRDTGEAASFQAKSLAVLDDSAEAVRYWDWTLTPVRGAGGQVQGLVLSQVDVTGRELGRHVREMHMVRLGTLLAVSQQVLAERTAEGILSRVVEAACDLADARLGLASHIGCGSAYILDASAGAAPAHGQSVADAQKAHVYLELFEGLEPVRMTTQELRWHPVWERLPDGHPLLRGLLGAPITTRDQRASGVILVSDKEAGEFTAEDEALLAQLAALASLSMQHVEARAEAERQATQKALLQSEQLAVTGRLAASIAHEVNNPLQSVIGSLELARELVEAGQDPFPYMEVALEEVGRASRIVGQMRDLNRRIEARQEPANVNALLERIMLLTRKHAQTHQVELSWKQGAQLPVVYLVVDQIQQVFLNLILNAVDAMPSGGRLDISTTCTVEWPGVQITFADTGVGIPSDQLAHLFEPFHSTKAHGVGLGLYITQSIVGDHGGRMDVESEVGKGTTFIVWLPAQDEPQDLGHKSSYD